MHHGISCHRSAGAGRRSSQLGAGGVGPCCATIVPIVRVGGCYVLMLSHLAGSSGSPDFQCRYLHRSLFHDRLLVRHGLQGSEHRTETDTGGTQSVGIFPNSLLPGRSNLLCCHSDELLEQSTGSVQHRNRDADILRDVYVADHRGLDDHVP